MSPLLAWTVGPLEVLVVGLVILLLFGNRLPSLMRSLGRGVVEFKKGVQGIDDNTGGDDLSGSQDREQTPVGPGRRT